MEANISRCSPGFNIRSPSFSYLHNDLPNELQSNVKLFTDDTSIFTKFKDKNESVSILNNDLLLSLLSIIYYSKWAYDWKMLFNSDPNKSTQEVVFSKKKKKKKKNENSNSSNHEF